MAKKSKYKRIYKPKCACNLTLVDGRCPEGCSDYKTPAQAIRLSERGAKPENNYGYLTSKDIENGILRMTRKMKLKPRINNYT